MTVESSGHATVATLAQKTAAEFVGTSFLLATVARMLRNTFGRDHTFLGTGIPGCSARRSSRRGGNDAICLLAGW